MNHSNIKNGGLREIYRRKSLVQINLRSMGYFLLLYFQKTHKNIAYYVPGFLTFDRV
jgi:hypothetical protein